MTDKSIYKKRQTERKTDRQMKANKKKTRGMYNQTHQSRKKNTKRLKFEQKKAHDSRTKTDLHRCPCPRQGLRIHPPEPRYRCQASKHPFSWMPNNANTQRKTRTTKKTK